MRQPINSIPILVQSSNYPHFHHASEHSNDPARKTQIENTVVNSDKATKVGGKELVVPKSGMTGLFDRLSIYTTISNYLPLKRDGT